MTHTKDEALKLALDALQEPLGFTGSREIDAKLREAITAIKQALAAPVQEHDVAFLRQVLSVAIAGLYAHYKDDVLRVFTLDDLQKVVDLSEPLQSQQVEDIYKRAWEMLATPPAAQPATEESSETQTASAYVKTYHGGKPWPLQQAPGRNHWEDGDVFERIATKAKGQP